MYFVSQLVYLFSAWKLCTKAKPEILSVASLDQAPPPSPLPPRGENTPSVTAGLVQALGNLCSRAAAATARSARGLSGLRPQRGPVHAGPAAHSAAAAPLTTAPFRLAARRPAARPCSQPPGGLATSSTASFPARKWVTPPLRSSARRRPCLAGRSRSPLRVRTRARAEDTGIVAAHARHSPAAARPRPARKRAEDATRVAT